MTVGELIEELKKYDENLDVAGADGFVIISVSLETDHYGKKYIQVL